MKYLDDIIKSLYEKYYGFVNDEIMNEENYSLYNFNYRDYDDAIL